MPAVTAPVAFRPSPCGTPPPPQSRRPPTRERKDSPAPALSLTKKTPPRPPGPPSRCVGLSCGEREGAETRVGKVAGGGTVRAGCSAVAVAYSDSVSNTCGGSKIILRTWTATDACGNSTNCVQTITVRDTMPPTITCPTNITLECPALPTTNVTGVATAHDRCSAVIVSYSDVVSN